MMRYLLTFVACLTSTPVLAQEVTGAPPSRIIASAISSNALQEVGPWGAAALPAGMVSISSDLWRGSDPKTLAAAFSRLSPDQRFPSMQVLVRQAVFSGGTAPTLDPDVTRTRFEAASKLGPAEAAARLIFAVPRLTSNPDLAAIAIDAGLRVGRVNEACGLIEAVVSPPQGTVWQENRATCFALNNEPDAANLSVDLARAAGQTDAWLSRAIAAVSGPLSAPPPFRIDSGRAIAISVRAQLRPPANLTNTPDVAGLSALLENTAFMERLTGAEQVGLREIGAIQGIYPAASLPSYLVRPAPVVEITEPAPAPDVVVQVMPEGAPATDVVVTVEAPVIAPIPNQITARILAAPNLLTRSMESRRVLAEIADIMATQPGLMTIADVPVLTEAALWGGDSALANTIAALVPSGLDPRLSLILAVYSPDKQASALSQFLASLGPDGVAQRAGLRTAMIFAALGAPVGDALSGLISTGLPTSPAGNVSLRLAIELAGARSSKGEVLILSALALQGEDVVNANFETVTTIVRNLSRVGLNGAAQDVARDYLLAQYIVLPVRAPVRPASRAPTRTRASTPTSSAPRAPTTPATPPNNRPSVSTPAPARPLTATPPPARPTVAAPARGAIARPLAPPPSKSTQSKPSWGTP